MHNQHRSPDPTKIERATATSTVALFFIFKALHGLTKFFIHSSRIMRTYHTHFGVPLGNTSGWWDDRKRNQKPVLPLYLRLDIPSSLSRALSCLRLSGHNFLVQRLRHDRNRRPYELRICDRCDWHTIQDEEHILLDCPHEHLVRLRTQQQLTFPPQFEDSPARLRTFMNQPDIFGVASFVAKCLALFP